ncbi:MAG: Hsp20/alpha crystallin family protein [Acidobacteriota bacterium]|jgi:HSP20 family protein
MADPLKELIALKERMNRLFENALSRSNFEEGPDLLDRWSPAVDIFETREDLVVLAEVPGLRQDGIDITLSEHTLSIMGERKMGRAMQEGNYHRIERNYGGFAIKFPLQTAIEPDRVQARYERGVLQVILPKTGQGPSRPVKVRLAG